MVGIFIGCMIPSAAFAAGSIDSSVAEQAGAVIYDLYGAYNNTSLAFEDIQPGPALTQIITLFQESQAATGGEPISMTAIGTALLAAGAIAVVYDAGEAVYELVVTLDYDSFGEFYQDFNQGWSDILSDGASLVRDAVTGLFNWSPDQYDVVQPIQIYSGRNFNGQPIAYSDYVGGNNQATFDVSTKLIEVFNGNNYEKGCTGVFLRSGEIYYFAVGSSYNVCDVYAASTVNQYPMAQITKNGVNSWYYAQLTTQTGALSNGLYIRYVNGINQPNDTIVPHIPLFSSTSEGTAAIMATPESIISVEPNPGYIGDPLVNPLEITIPDPLADPDEEAWPITIPTNWPIPQNIPIPGLPNDPVPGVVYPVTDPDTLNDLIPELWDDIVSGDVEVEPDADPDPDPGPGPDGSISEVFTPLLPTTLPSFDFNFSSIWHYVREWVTSLRSFFTVLFSVWAALPYAIVVPVYATAVIVIVLGVYKRFFG